MGCKKRLNKQKTGNKIYQAIDRSGKSYDKVAEELGLLSSRVIYEWVNGNKLPSLFGRSHRRPTRARVGLFLFCTAGTSTNFGGCAIISL